MTSLDKRPEQFVQGYRCAVKEFATWLHERARSMNDPHAAAVLNSAAYEFGRTHTVSRVD